MINFSIIAKVEDHMARGDNRKTKKMRRKKAQKKLKARVKKKIESGKKKKK
jgi:hypothetical protein